ncbi:MAG: SynChlorMet cassette protein ScmC [Syntrophaceae bacterium]|nr:SynChlorMet cassette protein ScmC [Syntrophaceae bacterium]
MRRMYGFQLSDGQTWGIEPGGDTGAWADTFARLLGLEPLRRLPEDTIRLERVPPPSGPEDVCRSAPHGRGGEGWHLRTSPLLEVWRHPSLREILCGLHETQDFSQVKEQMRCALFPVYDQTVRRGGLPLHGALVGQGGRGVLLVGRSGVGKSTACRRLPPRWDVLGDDLALAVRLPGGGFAVHPLPTWSAVGQAAGERTWDIRRGLGLSAVFFLTQAAEDEILPAQKAMATVLLTDAAMTIFQSVRVRERSMEKTLLAGNVFANAAAMAGSVPAYILRLSLTGRFWEKIEEVLELENGDSPLFRCETGEQKSA